MTHRIVVGTDFPIKPSDINAEEHLWNAFDNNETEVSAGYIVRLCQRKGGWLPFSDEEIESLYREAGHSHFSFNRLVEPGMAFFILRGSVPVGGGWIVKGDDGLYRVTDDFILRCFKSSPESAKAPQDSATP